MLNSLIEKLEAARMRVKLSKCKVLLPIRGHTPRLPDSSPTIPAQFRKDIPVEIPIVMDGMKVLGAPVGTPDYTQTTSIDVIMSYLGDLEGIHHLHMSSAYSLLKMCVNQRPNFLRRCTPRNETFEHLFNGFDKKIDTALSQIIGRTDMDPSDRIARGLPSRLGWMGIYRHSG
jgi:hypothetical protein